MTDFSVLIPAYNARATIARALRSVRDQTHLPREVIVCDDGSTDGTASIVAAEMPEAVVVRQPNRGLTAARNAALARATSEWVVLLDADDEWLPHRLERTREAIASNPTVDIVSCGAIVVDALGRRRTWEAPPWPEPAEQRVAILRSNFLFVSSAVRRSPLVQLGGFQGGLVHDSEYATWVPLLLGGSTAACVREPCVLYHQSGSTLSDDRVGTYEMVLGVLRRAAADFELTTTEQEALAFQQQRVERRMAARRVWEALVRGEAADAAEMASRVVANPTASRGQRVVFRAVSRRPRLVGAGVRHLPGRLLPATIRAARGWVHHRKVQ